MIEAMGAGLPVLGIESPGVGDTVNDGKDGLIIPEQDLAAFTAKMVRLGTDTNLRQMMSREARKTSESFDFRHTTKLMYELYERVIEETSVRRRSLHARWIRFWDQLR
jgi:glycosyltransferase involved in cell wall biosynthesis